MTESKASKLIALFHHKWSAAILAEMARIGGTRVVVLRSRLGANPQAIASALVQLIDIGLVAPNPGYGHPLRPEYVLTAEGRIAAGACARITSSTQRLGLPELPGYKWPLPVLWALGREPLRFGEIARCATPITDRALSQSLRLLTEVDLVRSSLLDVRPPASVYEPTRRAKLLIESLGVLAA